MATYTSNYGWTKPSGSDNVDISVLNNNLDGQDGVIHDAFLNMAPPFSESSTYDVDDIVLYGTGLYKCHTAVVTPGSWTGSTNWQVYKLSEGGSGGGGTSNYNNLTNKPSINSVTLTGNKTTGDLGLQDKTQYSTMPTASADNEGKIYQYVGTTDANYTNGYYYKCVENNGSYSWQLVENIKEQTPTFSQASTRNNIASGEKLSVILGKIQKFFNDLKTVAFSGSFSDLSNKPENANTFQGTIAEWNQLSTAEKKAYDHASIPDSIDGGVTFPANKVVMTGGGNVEEALNTQRVVTVASVTANGVKTYRQLLNEIYTSQTGNDNVILSLGGEMHQQYFGVTYYGGLMTAGGGLLLSFIRLGSGNSQYKTYVLTASSSPLEDKSLLVPAQGTVIKLIKFL